MFKSKSFIIAFSALSLLIVTLIVIFFILVFGKGQEMLTQGIMVGTVEEEAETAQIEELISETASSEEPYEEETTSETESETEATTVAEIVTDTSIRPLTAEETHTYPIINENIAEKGVISIVKSGDNGEGIVFHKLPQFDSSSAEGNVVKYGGSYDVTGKIFIMNNDRPFLMYQTSDGLYCTSSTVYMSYTAQETAINPNANKIGAFGVEENEGVQVVVHCEDGNHVVFSVYDYNSTSAQTTPVLENVIAEYNSIGVASFEYHYSDGEIHTGTISFEKTEDGLIVDLNFQVPMAFAVGERSEVVLHK